MRDETASAQSALPSTNVQPTDGAGAGHRYAHVHEVADYLAGRTTIRPHIAIVLGTGLDGVADTIQNPVLVDYSDIPHFPRTTVLGHRGRLVFGLLHGISVAAMQGRFHIYEGYSPQQVVLPIRALKLLGADMLLVTNAAGGLNPSYAPGTLMLIRDSIGLPMLSGLNPLIGPNDESFGPRFHALTGAYDVELRQLAHAEAIEEHIELVEGVYAMVTGPSFESQAELRFLRMVGADAIGMSTVPEVIAARHMGMRVLAMSCITNKTLQDEGSPILDGDALHQEVNAAANAAGPRLAAILSGVVRRLPR